MSNAQTYVVESVVNGQVFRECAAPMTRENARKFLADLLRGFRRAGASIIRERCSDGFTDYHAMSVDDDGARCVELSYFDMMG